MDSVTSPNFSGYQAITSSGFIAPTNGFVIVYCKKETGTIYIYVNDVIVTEYNQNHSYGCTNASFPVGKGQTVTYTSTWNRIYFVPYS